MVNPATAPPLGKHRVWWDDLPGRVWRLAELLIAGSFVQPGDHRHGSGSNLELPPADYSMPKESCDAD